MTQQGQHACQALCKEGGVALCLADKEVQVLVHDLLLAGIGHHLLLVLHHPLSLAPELHGLHSRPADHCYRCIVVVIAFCTDIGTGTSKDCLGIKESAGTHAPQSACCYAQLDA